MSSLYIVALLFNLYAEYIMWNARLDEAQAGIQIARRNISHLRYADDTTLMAESKEELKSLLMKMKQESEKVDLKLNIQKTKIMASGPIERVTGRKARDLQMEEIACKCQTFLSLLRGRRKQTRDIFSFSIQI